MFSEEVSQSTFQVQKILPNSCNRPCRMDRSQQENLKARRHSPAFTRKALHFGKFCISPALQQSCLYKYFCPGRRPNTRAMIRRSEHKHCIFIVRKKLKCQKEREHRDLPIFCIFVLLLVPLGACRKNPNCG